MLGETKVVLDRSADWSRQRCSGAIAAYQASDAEIAVGGASHPTSRQQADCGHYWKKMRCEYHVRV
jgi:hypothetical protein